MTLQVSTVPITPFQDQKPGTSGLRKNVTHFMQPHYVESFTQSILLSLGDSLPGSTLVLGGDGRFYNDEAILKIIQICAANGVGKLLVGHDGILSTPAVSCLIRNFGCDGGIILTASHNPGGRDGSFGIKFNNDSGAPATQKIGDLIFSIGKKLTNYKICPQLSIDVTQQSKNDYWINNKKFQVEVIDSCFNYVELLKEIFDFGLIKKYLVDNKVLVNCLNGVMGPYSVRIFCEELGCPRDYLVNYEPLDDFGGRHPDPNLTYAKDLVDDMKKKQHQLGVAFDGDGDRCMVIGFGGFFVNPCDVLSLVAEKLQTLPYFSQQIFGVARSMATSSAVDRVAAEMGIKCYETPTGWKYFGNLLDNQLISLCGEESFGIGASHIREKDGMFGALSVLSIMAHSAKSLEDLCTDHWVKFGRVYFTRYDFEEIEDHLAQRVMAVLEDFINSPNVTVYGTTRLTMADNFEYEDPVDGSVTSRQGVRIVFEDSSRVVFRLSGTGTCGATIRLYAEKPGDVGGETQEVLRELVEFAMEVSRLREITGRNGPTVVT